uniref:Putative secreted protein n=1 Tax=Haematobia irritans TaxID=7368 RepID=A0A1L8EG95_HAEIR
MRFLLSIGVVFIVYLAYVHSDSCVQCNSSSDPKCATNPEQFLSKQCANTTSQCYVRVLDGVTYRGCASDLDNATATNCNNNMECLICGFMEGCNSAVFPQHRLSCLQCSGDYNSTCATVITTKPVVCPTYKLGDKCYIRRDEKNTTTSFQRGCLSTARSNAICKDESNCYTCEGAGCNFLEANSTYIPVARDSALGYGSSMVVVLMAFLLTRQS